MNDRDRGDACSLTIGRMQNVYLVPREHPALQGMQSRLDEVATKYLADACRRLLSHVLNTQDSSVWIVRRLEVDLPMTAKAMNHEATAHAWAHGIGSVLHNFLAHPSGNEDVIRFADRKTYLAQFLADLVAGRAWSKWYYQPFESLRSLPLSAALREALIREPDQLESVLLHLAGMDRINGVLDILSTSDAARVYEACLFSSSTSGVIRGRREHIEMILAVWRSAGLRDEGVGMATPHNALRLYIALRSGFPMKFNAGSFRRVAELTLGFAEILHQVDSPEALVGCLLRRDLLDAMDLMQSCGFEDHFEILPVIGEIADGDAKWISALLSVLGPSSLGSAKTHYLNYKNNVGSIDEARTAALCRTFYSSFAGVFLLLQEFLDTGLTTLIDRSSYVDLDEVSKAQALRYLVALKCFGRSRVLETRNDPALCLATGCESPPPTNSLRRWSHAAGDNDNELSLKHLMEQLAVQMRFDGRLLHAGIYSMSPKDFYFLLLRDIAHDEWVYGSLINPDADANLTETLERGITLIREAVQDQLISVVLGQGFERKSVAALTSNSDLIMHLQSESLQSVPQEFSADLNAFLSRAKPPAQELRYFTLMDLELAPISNASFDFTWSIIARGVLKAFARRLMGFSWSSADFLYHNFLAGEGRIHVYPEKIEVRLPSSPLGVVLRMAGVDGQSYIVPWLENSEVELILPQG